MLSLHISALIAPCNVGTTNHLNLVGVDSELNLLHCTFLLDNEVDGEAFLLLTDDQIRMLVKALGPQMKLIKKKTLLNTSTHQVSALCGN